MRSVQLFPTADVSRLTTLLDSVGERRETEWFDIAGGVLEVGLAQYGSSADLLRAVEAEGSCAAQTIDALRQVQHELGGCWLDVRVSGHVDGQVEMRNLVLLLLGDGGYAADDYSDHLWSLSDIHQSLQISGETFRA